MRKALLLSALLPAACALAVWAISSAVTESVEDDTKPGGFCELHHIPYAVETIPVHYGYPVRPELTEAQRNWLREEYAAACKSFPHSHEANGAGGCVVRAARFAKVSYCPECRRVDEEWHAKHGHSL
jgi:hypothetical protein